MTHADLALASPATRAGLPSQDRFAELFASLEQLLCAGGDERIDLGRATKSNPYGCTPWPQPSSIGLSSSTASSISERAYGCARKAQQRLIEACATEGVFEAFETAMENTRRSILTYLDLQDSGATAVLTPSGTDAQLVAMFLAAVSWPLSDISCVIVGADQTGSGAPFASAGRHFNTRTWRGAPVQKGLPIALGKHTSVVAVPFARADGTWRTPDDMDEAVRLAVEREIAKGRKVVLQTMSASKFGWRSPSQSLVHRLAATFSSSLRVIVDACQLRTSPILIARHLDEDHLVLITGSKFYTGPAFSGAILVPPGLSHTCSNNLDLPGGLYDYLSQSDLPWEWAGPRAKFAPEPNFGLFLRWAAALEEMRNYQSLPLAYRTEVIKEAGAKIATTLAANPRLSLIAPSAWAHVDDGEFSSPTIFPFLLKDESGYLTPETVAAIHRALNRNLDSELCKSSEAQRRCHIGQPVQVTLENGQTTAALRIALGARTLFETWSHGPSAKDRAVLAIAADVEIVLKKLDLLLENSSLLFEPLGHPRIVPGHGA